MLNSILKQINYNDKALFIINKKIYWWQGWFGCQLASLEWIRLPAGTTREFNFGGGNIITMTIFTTKRVGLRVLTTWALPDNGTLDEHQGRIMDLKNQLFNLI